MISTRRGCIHRLISFVLQGVIWILAALFALWAVAALWYDFPVMPHVMSVVFGVLLVVLLMLMRRSLARAISWVLASLAVLA